MCMQSLYVKFDQKFSECERERGRDGESESESDICIAENEKRKVCHCKLAPLLSK